ncbi:DUF6993 domain-containing protein [Microbacterium kyungheense]|uniref:DUF6993 domain-containing protein n=1 Tax=Microbacterium kyungheense TaxID=1263636 RepID=A0A543F2R3_9MICO|nr:hypothetical protein [Microbacterium kyungheense]TQM28111.1 hypothetical protein FB391_2163 [Microbacterium kyungheense]
MARHPASANGRPSFARRAGLVGATALAVAVVTACAPVTPTPTPSVSPSGTIVVPTPSASASDGGQATPAALVPDGTAHDNLPYFTAVTDSVWASESRVSGRAYIDALVAAGFDKSAMQVTSDTTTVGNPAESIQFSVRWGEECLVGQVGPATGDPVTVVVPVVGEGTCLIGQTRPIDW